MTTAETEGNRLKGLAGQSGVYLVGTIIGQAAGLITFPLFARVLGPSQYGTFALITGFVALGRTLMLGGVNTSLIRFYVCAAQDRRRRVVGSSIGYALLVGLASNAVAWAFGSSLSMALFGSVDAKYLLIVRLGVLSLTLDVLVELLLALARARNAPKVFVLGTTARVVANIVLAVVFLLMVPMGVSGAMLALVGSNIAALVALAVAQRAEMAVAFDRRLVWTLVAFGAALVPANMASWALNVIDRYMLQHIVGSTSVGLYSAAYRVGTIISLVYIAPFHQAWLPHMLQEADSGDGPKVIGRVGRYFFAGGILLVILLSAFGPEILRLLAGARYASASSVIPMVALGVLLGGTVSVFAPGVMLANRTWLTSVLFVLGAAVNVVANFLLIPPFGMLGAAAATLIAYLVVAVGHVIVSQRLYPVEFKRGALVVWLGLAVASAAVMSLISGVMHSEWQSFAARLGAAVVLVGLMSPLGLIERDELEATWRWVRGGFGTALRGWGSRSPRAARVASRIRGAGKHVLFAGEILHALMRNAGVTSVVEGPEIAVGTGAIMPLVNPLPEGRDKFIRDAERILMGARRALSFGVPEGSGHYWHTDALALYRWPMVYHKTLDLGETIDRADPKIPWELSRLHHLPVLGQAYAVSSDERFASYARREIENWAESNPVGFGINWVVAMEVGVRAINIAVAHQLLRRSEVWDEAWCVAVDDLLVRHAEFIERNVEDWGAGTQNHYIADMAALAVAGWAIGSRPLAERSAEALLRCVREQILPDGVDFENSTSYHRIVFEMLVIGALACRAGGVEVDAEVWGAVERMANYIDAYTRPDGTAPAVGDADDGRILMFDDYFDWRPDQHAYVLTLACRLFGTSYSSLVTTSSLWGQCFDVPDVSEGATAVSGPHSSAFADGGMYVMSAEGVHALLNCAPTGVGGLGPHRHNDALSYDLWVGQPIVVDSGTFVYLRDTKARKEFRSTAAHNTVQVDGAEQNDLSNMFALPADTTDINVLEWDTSGHRDLLRAECRCGSSDSGVVWRREFLRVERSFTVTDRLEGQGRHDVSCFTHLPVGLEPDIRSTEDVVSVMLGPVNLKVSASRPFDLKVESGFVSPSFGIRTPAAVLVLRLADERLPVEIRFEFSWDPV